MIEYIFMNKKVWRTCELIVTRQSYLKKKFGNVEMPWLKSRRIYCSKKKVQFNVLHACNKRYLQVANLPTFSGDAFPNLLGKIVAH
jgi:hypothetical protein